MDGLFINIAGLDAAAPKAAEARPSAHAAARGRNARGREKAKRPSAPLADSASKRPAKRRRTEGPPRASSRETDRPAVGKETAAPAELGSSKGSAAGGSGKKRPGKLRKRRLRGADPAAASEEPKERGKKRKRGEEPAPEKEPEAQAPKAPAPPPMAAFAGAKAGAGGDGVTSGTGFKRLKLHDSLQKQLEFLNFAKCTPIQAAAIPPALKGRDVLLRAPTGSGKTLAFLLPVLHRLLELPSEARGRSQGTLALVLSPTKELVLQTLKVAQDLIRMVPSLVCGAVAGGEKPKSEKARLRKGLPLLCATPGRLTYHLEHTATLVTDHLCCFVLDEADRLLDMGFEPQIRAVHKRVIAAGGEAKAKTSVQTLLASATLAPGVRRLAQFCLRDNAYWADPESPQGKGKAPTEEEAATNEARFSVPSTLTQWFCVVPCKERLVTLIAAIASKVANGQDNRKAIVFFSACASVDFHHDLFVDARWPSLGGFSRGKRPQGGGRHVGGGFVAARDGAEGLRQGSEDEEEAEEEAPEDEDPQESGAKVFEGTRLFKLHGNLSKEERAGYINDFAKAGRGVLLASDAASRGLDFPKIDWIIQYDPPQRTEEYLHRVGRTARIGNAGNALVFLQPSETGFLDVLRSRGLKDLRELRAGQLHNALLSCRGAPQGLERVRDIPTFWSADIASRVAATAPLAAQARSAFNSALKAYRTFPRELRAAFPAGQLHMGHYAASFALREAPTQASRELRRAAGVDSGRGRGRGGRGSGRAGAAGGGRAGAGRAGGGRGGAGGRGGGGGRPGGGGPAAPRGPSAADEFAS